MADIAILPPELSEQVVPGKTILGAAGGGAHDGTRFRFIEEVEPNRWRIERMDVMEDLDAR